MCALDFGSSGASARAINRIFTKVAGGLYYDRGEYFVFLSQPAGSDYGGPFGVTESAPLATYVTGQGSSLSDTMGPWAALPSATSPR
jgi:hypothetical protein